MEKCGADQFRNVQLFSKLSGVLILIAATGTSYAQWSGQTVTAEWRYPSFGDVLESHDVVVGPGIELSEQTILNDDKFNIDLGADTVQFNFNALSNWTNTTFNGWRFADTNGSIPDIVGYSIDATSAGIAGLTDAALGFDANSVWANFGGMTVAGNGDFVRLKVSFAPEPASMTLLALVGTILVRRRR